MTSSTVLVFIVIISFILIQSHAQLSNPITHDSHVLDPGNKFLQRKAGSDTEGLSTLDEEEKTNSQCPSHLELKWQTEVASSVYSTPVIADINGDGKSEIVVSSFVHYLEVLEGADGEKLSGWPAFHKSSAHTSPVLHDADNDGMAEVLLATYNGEILMFSHTGEEMTQKFTVPRLRLKRSWYVGLNPDPVDHTNPDIHANLLEEESGKAGTDLNATKVPTNILNLPQKDEKVHEISQEASQKVLQEPELPMPDHLPSEEDKILRAVASNASAQSSGPANPTTVASGTKEKDEKLEHKSTDGNATEGAVEVQEGAKTAATKEGGEAAKVEAVTAERKEEAKNVSGEVTNAGGDKEAEKAAAAAKAKAEAEAAELAEEHREEQQALVLSWEAWHADLIAKNHEFTKEQQQKWEQFVAWRASHGLDPESRKAAEGGSGAAGRRLLQAGGEDDGEVAATVEEESSLDDDGAASWDVFQESGEEEEEVEGEEEELEHPGGAQNDEYHYDYDEYDPDKQDEMWGDEDWTETEHESDEEFVAVDAHILCTPVVADIDGDGVEELIVAASYFYDREYYEVPAHKEELPENVDIGKYIAGAVVVFDLLTQRVKWSTHLDLTTENTQFRAYIYSAPTVVDLDKDGKLEIIVGTSVGFIYCLNSDGTSRHNFPIQMGEVQGQVVVADINGDGELEIVAGDTKGNIAAFSALGKEVWERHTGHLIAQGATVGDVDGDGQLEVVVTTTGGHVWVLNGDTGEDHGAFPFRAHGRIMVPPLLVRLEKDKSKRGLHIAVIAFDGYLYIIDGRTGCADAIDIGETSYSMVLADQVDGGDDLDLIVATMNGNVFCFQTPAPYHPLKAWSSQNQGKNVPYPRYGNKGISFLHKSRQFRDISTQKFTLEFEIVDSRPQEISFGAHYDVIVWLLLPGDKKKVEQRVYDKAGVYSVTLDCPPYRTNAMVRIEMEDEHKVHFFDEFALSFHMYFYRIFKWIVVLPLLCMLAALVLSRPKDSDGYSALPSFRMNRN